ncbi:hypothetical protein ACA910_001475 [Epithemia clementina (nom. ined.)]
MRTNSIAFLAALAAPSFLVAALPIETCQAQWPCLRFTHNLVETTNVCEDENCEYQVCMTLDLDGANCNKDSGDTVSHTCEKPGTGVCLDGGGFRDVSTEINGIANGYSSCQIVPPGGVAEFLIKDGNSDMGCGSSANTLAGGVTATCEMFGSRSCTGGGNIGKECVWRIQAPTSCGHGGGGGGDPHFKLWNRTRYSYHGECDLVLVQSNAFAQGLGLDLHIRTTIHDFYSYIEAAALRIGDTVLEVSGGRFWITGVEGSDDGSSSDLSGFTLHPAYTIGKAKVYQVDLNRGDKILFRNYKHFMFVDITGNADDFADSIGLMGDYATGDMLARDGMTVITDTNAFGQEWQVRGNDEPALFHESREPQHPAATCRMPTAKMTGRNLRDRKTVDLIKIAEDACSGKSAEDFEFCVLDVLATGDVTLAEVW